MLIPQPGEIWEVSRLVQSPLKFSSQEQETLYSATAQNFLAGNSPPRYVMIVKEPESLLSQRCVPDCFCNVTVRRNRFC